MVTSQYLTLSIADHLIVILNRYIGTMQICVARMLQESGIFFAVIICALSECSHLTTSC